MIADVKLSMVTSDLKGLNQIVDRKNAEYEEARLASEERLVRVAGEVDTALHKLESHYYKSIYR